MVGALAVVLVALALAATGTGIGSGALGVALVLILQFNSLLSQTVQAWTKVETSIGAVARVFQFVQDTPSEEPGTAIPAAGWPVRGVVEFKNIAAGYTPNRPPVLVNFSLSITAQEKIAICGTSGSGKTSLILALLKMAGLRSGQILIDGVDIETLEGNDVRSRVNVVSQEPYFMPGTIRFNLDPRNQADDNTMEAAIREVGLWDKISSDNGLLGELDMPKWSIGERQLLSLARALLNPSKLLILDEAMSNVDEEMEALMQTVMAAEFIDRTMIAIMHRYTYVRYFNRVVVLKNGRLVECDKPEILLSRKDTAFRELYNARNH